MGYPADRFVSNVDQNLLCNICTGVMNQAVVTLCGHSFCELCLKTWLDKPDTDSCPTCRSYTSKFDMIPNIAVRNMIDVLLVWCDNSENGCKIVVKLESLRKHLEKCDYRQVKCSACGVTIPRNELANHYKICAVIEEELRKSKERTAIDVTVEALQRQIAALEMDLSRTRLALKDSEKYACSVAKELEKLRQEHEIRDSNQRQYPEWDPDYAYGYSPSSIAQLACLLSKYLLDRPSCIDRNRVFMAIKRCYTYYHNYAGYSQDVHMLLATSCACNWFQDHQKLLLERWLEQVTLARFPVLVNTRSVELEYR
ncbi:E3 ubiquitin-protein ligase NRDP1-like [Rhopilema esculentum]|uniref:E3 ubiquitin-protein ligase NRDP1-like n=1 Tax=Rhopilema esculentum TaxID=499914 RepID=UPI0031DBC523|eukprot:gene13464-4341_t